MISLEAAERDKTINSAEEAPSPRGRGILAAAVLLLVLLLIVCGLFPFVFSVVPNVVGFDVQEAREIIEGAGFEVRDIEERPARDVPPGEVIRQTPREGTRASRGSGVDLYIASDRAKEAERLPGIDDLGITWGEPLRAPRPVGPSEVRDRRPRIPMVLGMTRAETIALLRANGYRFTLDFGYSTTAVPPGNVFYQNPPPDTVASRGTVVSIWISTGHPDPNISAPQEPRPPDVWGGQ